MSLDISVVRCEALFASSVQSSEAPTEDQIRDAIMRTVRALGSRGCAAVVAKEFGDHPELAIRRMRWARQQVAALVQTPQPIAVNRILGKRMFRSGASLPSTGWQKCPSTNLMTTARVAPRSW